MKSAARPERERLLPPALVLTFIALVGVGLALVFPRETLRERLLLHGGAASGLTIAYLEAWWRASPGDLTFMGALAEQYAHSGRLDDAEAMLARIEAVKGVDLAAQILLTRIGIARRRVDAEPLASPRREPYLARLRALLAEATARAWSQGDLQQLATLARQVDAHDAAAHFYRELARTDRAHAGFWNRELAGIALASGNYREAAGALFEEQARAATLAGQRSLFLEALQTLQSGNLLDEALAEAERHGGRLLDDPEVLRYLTRLALAANRPDLASRYVERLLRVTSRKVVPGAAVLADRGAAAHRIAAGPRSAGYGIVFLDGPAGVALRRSQASAGRLGLRRVAQDGMPPPAEPAGAPEAAKPFNADDYDLAYRVFLAAGKLGEAQQVAEVAVRMLPGDPVWRERLAQVAEWNGQPAVALRNWLVLAQAGHSERAWTAVMRLAPGLSDDRAYLAALLHRVDPADMKSVDDIVAAYERLGEPEAAMAFLDGISHGPATREVVERNAALAERAGKDERAYRLYVQLQQRFGPRPAYSLKLANLLYARGRISGALDALLPARATARADDLLYWRTLATLARLNQRDDLLEDVHRHLLGAMAASDAHCLQLPAGGERNACLEAQASAEEGDLSSLLAFYDRTPLDAGRIAEAYWRKHGKTESLEQALSYYTRARAYARVERLLASLAPEQLRAAEQSAHFLTSRAAYFFAIGENSRSIADLRRASRLPDAGDDTLAALLWAEIDLGTDSEVRALMRRLRDRAEDSPDLWGAFAAGHMRFGDGRSVLHYLHKQNDGKVPDPLWLGLAANAYDSIGQTQTAWRIRRQAWVLLHDAVSGRDSRRAALRGAGHGEPDAEDADAGLSTLADLQHQTVALGHVFASGDVSRALVIQMLRADRAATAAASASPSAAGARSRLGDVGGLPSLQEALPPPGILQREHRRQAVLSAAGRDTALAWALSTEANTLARAWLAKYYARTLERPAYAEIALALDSNDLDTLDRVLERQAGRVPAGSETGANQRLDRLAAAQTGAYAAQEAARTDDLTQQTLQDVLLFNAQAIEPRVTYGHQRPVEYFDSFVAGGVRLWGGYDLNLRGQWREQHSIDSSQLVNVPPSDQRAELSVGYRDTQTRWRATVGYRDGLDTMATARFFGEWRQQGRLSFSTLAGYNQPADESVALRVGGAKDVVAAGATWRAGFREFAGVRIEYDSFRGQDRSALGHGIVYDVEAGYRFRTNYPDYTVRVVATHASYSTHGGTLTPTMASLVPAGQAPAPAFYMPESFTQAGVVFSVGTELIDAYTRKWRPFGEVGVLSDTRARQNFRIQAGVAGSVFGNDHLSFYVSHESASRNGGVPFTEAGLRYRWLY